MQEKNVTRSAALIISCFNKVYVGGADAMIKINQIYVINTASSNDTSLDFQMAWMEKELKMTSAHETTMRFDSAAFGIDGTSAITVRKLLTIQLELYGYIWCLGVFFSRSCDRWANWTIFNESWCECRFLKVPWHDSFQNNLQILFWTFT